MSGGGLGVLVGQWRTRVALFSLLVGFPCLHQTILIFGSTLGAVPLALVVLGNETVISPNAV